MPRLDAIHDAVKNALIKDGWVITDDPYIIDYKKTKLFADLAAERAIAAVRDDKKIVVEVKSFVGISKIQDLKEALGQYDIYFYLLEETAPEHKLYVAISEVSYKELFKQDAIKLIISRHKLPLIIVNVETEEIVKWIS